MINKLWTKEDVAISDCEIEPLMTQSEVSELLSRLVNISYRIVYDRWVHLPDFPRPILLPSITGKRGIKRWQREDIISFASRYRKAA